MGLPQLDGYASPKDEGTFHLSYKGYFKIEWYNMGRQTRERSSTGIYHVLLR